MATRLDYDPERRKALADAVAQGWSLNEIRRTLGIDHRTVKRHYPDYGPYPVGGGGDAAIIRETNRQLTEFLRRGKIGSNRDAGYNKRSET